MFKRIKEYISENTGILIRLDDIAENMNWHLMEKSEDLFDKYKIKPVLGVIPNNKDGELLSYPKKNDFWDKVRGWQNKGWKISMHGLTHVYDKDTKRNDYFRHGGRSEFCGHSLDTQIERIKEGLNIFKKEGIKIETFFAPNHTYDKNTFNALKKFGINEVIDGYGLMPYKEMEIKFIPQLFYKVYALPFGIQATQIHLNYWKDKDFLDFESFIRKNKNNFICYEDALKKINNGIHYRFLNGLTKTILRSKRAILNFKS